MGGGSSRVNESTIKNSPLVPQNPFFYKVSPSICKIKTNASQASGFFLKILLDNDMYYYFLISNEHVITQEIVNNKEKIIAYYAIQEKNVEITLDKKERYIKCFKDINGIDATVVQILPKDDVFKDYFLSSYLDKFDKKDLINYQIFIPQYPLGQNITISEGNIKKISSNEIIHLSSTEAGSSGSPIFLKDTTKVIGIHKSGDFKNQENLGDLISPIIDIIKNDFNTIF